MTTYEKLYKGISQAAWGYLFIFLHINIGTVDILPDFAGYLLFLSAINLLKEFIAELSLIRTIGIILTAWNFIDWMLTIIGYQIHNLIQVVNVITVLINLYFHFQLLTDLSAVASKYQHQEADYDRKLLKYRTCYIIIITVFNILGYFPSLSEDAMTISTIIMIFGLIFGVASAILIMKTLFGLRKNLAVYEDNQPEQTP